MMLTIANMLIFESSPFFGHFLFEPSPHACKSVVFFVEGENSWYIRPVSSPTSTISGNFQTDAFIQHDILLVS